MFSPGDARDLRVITQRGACGIDGLVSGAAGVADVAGRPVTLLLGDVSLLHDLHGLLTLRDREWPLVVVVLNNQGGRLFEQLPLAHLPEVRESFDRLFVTADLLDFHGIARMISLEYARAGSADDLRDALRAAHEGRQCILVEAAVDPDSAGVDRQTLIARVGSGGSPE